MMITELSLFPDNISNADDYRAMCKTLVDNGVNFHPDDDPNDYVNYETGTPSFSPAVANRINELFKQAFVVLEGDEPYTIGLEALEGAAGFRPKHCDGTVADVIEQ